MKCYGEGGKCLRREKCKHACELRVTCTEGEAYRRGWQDCMKVWEGHMERMNLAMKRKPKA